MKQKCEIIRVCPMPPPWSKPLTGALDRWIVYGHTFSKNIYLKMCRIYPGKIFFLFKSLMIMFVGQKFTISLFGTVDKNINARF